MSPYLEPLSSPVRRRLIRLSALPASCGNGWLSRNDCFRFISTNGDTSPKFKEISGGLCTVLLLTAEKSYSIITKKKKRKVIKKRNKEKQILASFLPAFTSSPRLPCAVRILVLPPPPQELPSSFRHPFLMRRCLSVAPAWWRWNGGSHGLHPSGIWFGSSNSNRLLQANSAPLISFLPAAFQGVSVILAAGGSGQSALRFRHKCQVSLVPFQAQRCP